MAAPKWPFNLGIDIQIPPAGPQVPVVHANDRWFATSLSSGWNSFDYVVGTGVGFDMVYENTLFGKNPPIAKGVPKAERLQKKEPKAKSKAKSKAKPKAKPKAKTKVKTEEKK